MACTKICLENRHGNMLSYEASCKIWEINAVAHALLEFLLSFHL